MNSLERVRTLLIDHLKEALTCRSEQEKLLLISVNKDLIQRIDDAFSNLIADPTQSPESIIHLLDTYTRELNGFSTNKSFQNLVGFACLEGLARRRPKALNGPWETLVWMIVKYSSFLNNTIGYGITHYMKTKIKTLKFITEFVSTELCPNPCLRLELFRVMRSFSYYLDFDYDRESFRDKIIKTLFELCDNYTSLTIYQVPNVCPMDLQYLLKDNNINMGYIMNDYDLEMKKSEIIAAVLKLTRNFALLEKEKHESLNNQATVHGILYGGIKRQLSACLCFCGLIPLNLDDDSEHNECLVYLVQAVKNDALLLNSVIDTLETITQVSLSFPDNGDLQNLQNEVIHMKDKLLYEYFKGHNIQFPTNQYLHEMYGGLSPAEEYRLRYFQNNIIDLYNDSDNDSESNSSNENDNSYNFSEENVSEIDISD